MRKMDRQNGRERHKLREIDRYGERETGRD
jgi:hypothetical protein